MSDKTTELTPRNIAKQTFLRREHQIRELEEKSITDELTGLLNLRGLRRELGTSYSHAVRTGEKLIIMWVDLDNLGWINEHYSYEDGNRVLVEVAETMKKMLREPDTKARWGGDEFVGILLRDKNKLGPDEEEMKDRLNQVLKNNCPTGINPNDVGVTVTLEEWNQKDPLEELLRKIDDHARADKRMKKNQ